MPCYDAGPSREQVAEESLNQRIADAMLCAILRTEDGQKAAANLTDADIAKSGVTREQFKKWWIRHVQIDEKRAQEQAKKSAIEKQRREALAKLSAEERAALGLK